MTLNRAIRALEQAEAKIVELEHRLEQGRDLPARAEPIAIIGMGCRFPRGRSPDAFWRSLVAGRDAVSEIPASRWTSDAALRKARWAALLDEEDVAGFDAAFFAISPREAAAMDPQQRLLLQVAVEALEDAGIDLHSLQGTATGTFIGMMTLDYQQLTMALPVDRIDLYTSTGIGACFGSGRLSHLLGFEGPSVSTDTACSSSLVALHLACQSLRVRECNLAVCGGVNLMLSPWTMRLFVQMQALSPEGRCRTFDARSNGFVRGEGCGALILKRLSDALRDGDSIHAVIRGSAINHNGRSSSLTAPSVLAQQALLRQALATAELAPTDLDYIEAHGIATPLGDPIEIDALKAVIGAPRADGSTCAIGSVKTNIGHLEAAAGIAGIIKTVLALEHEQIPPHLHLEALNPRISTEGSALTIEPDGRAWMRGARVRRAGVSAFGLSGANAHVLLEEAPAVQASARAPARAGDTIVVITARSAASLQQLAARYADALEADAPPVHDVAYTTLRRRSHHPHRLAIIGASARTIAAGLRGWLAGTPGPEVHAGVADANGAPRQAVHGSCATSELNGSIENANRAARSITPGSLDAVAAAFVAGATVDWARVAPPDGRLVRLPSYAWVLDRHWIEAERGTAASPAMEPAAAVAATVTGTPDRAAAPVAPPSPLIVQTWQPRSPDAGATVADGTPTDPGPWWIAGGDPHQLEGLAAALRAVGQHATTWTWPSGAQAAASIMDDEASEAALAAAIEAALVAACATEDVRGILVIGPAVGVAAARSGGDHHEHDGAALQTGVERACRRVARLAQVAARRRWRRSSPRLWLITGGAQLIGDDQTAAPALAMRNATPLTIDPSRAATVASPQDRPRGIEPSHTVEPVLAGAALWGLGRALSLEHPELRCTRVDLAPYTGADWVRVAAEILRDGADEELGLRGGRWYAGQLARVEQPPRRPRPHVREPSRGRPFRLELDRAGILDQLTYRVLSPVAPGPGEVRVRVEAAGLNFMDVMTAMGIYPGRDAADGPIVLGGECSGQIDAVGPDVTAFAVGDPVVAVGRGCFGSHITTDVAYVQRRPAALDPGLAAGVPIVFLTAWYALITLGRLGRGERVLIHSAASGVGLAAVQIAQWRGAEVHATAGTEAKRALLRGMGVASVMDSRSIAFADEVRAATGGAGVDLVLNSLAGPAIEASFAALASDGRFFEIGKTDIYAEARAVALAPFRKRIAYQAVDLLGLAEERKDRFAALFAEVMDAFATGVLRPLPTTTLDAAHAGDAFRRMAEGRHTGKLAVAIAGREVELELGASRGLAADASYLITGATGALGGALTEWLVDRGARRIVWLGRRGQSPAHAAQIDALRARGVELAVYTGDVGRLADVTAAVRAAEAMAPLRGVMHATSTAKLAGAWNLHRATAHAALDLFVMFSSAGALLGAADRATGPGGAAGDAVANAGIDGLARVRARHGLAATSLQWGAFARDGSARLDPRDAWRTLGAAVAAGTPELAMIELDARQLIEFFPHLATGTRFLPLLAGSDAPVHGGDRALLDRFAAARDRERAQLIDQLIRDQLAAILRIAPATIDTDAPFKALGIDSLMGLELRNRLEAALGLTLSAALIWAYPDPRALAEYLHGRLITSIAAVSAPVPAAPPPPPLDAAASDPHAALLEQELASLERLLSH